jgi:hypothetical protein
MQSCLVCGSRPGAIIVRSREDMVVLSGRFCPAGAALDVAGVARPGQRDGLAAVRARSRSTAAVAASRAAPMAIRAICQPGMPPMTTVRT